MRQVIFVDGSKVPAGVQYHTDTVINSFDIQIHPLETVGEEDLRDLVQTKYEVTNLQEYGENNFFVQIRAMQNVNESLKDLIETKWQVLGFQETEHIKVAV